MKFIDFLPDLSMAFLLWSGISFTVAAALWLLIFIVIRLVPKSFSVRFEFIVVFILFVVVILVVKMTLLSRIPLSVLFGANRFVLISLFVILTAVLFLVFKRHINKIVDKMVYTVDRNITPLVGLFAVFFMISIPLSVLNVKENQDIDFSENVYSGQVLAEGSPNFLLIVLDTLTSLDMQMYGYGRSTTPFLKEWTKKTIVFNKAYSPSNWTGSSVMSLMTGQRLWTHGYWNISKRRALTSYDHNLPKVLKENGYNVFGFIQNRHAHPETLGIINAFDQVDEYYSFYEPFGWWFDKIGSLFDDRIIVKEWIFELNFISKMVLAFRPDRETTQMPPEKVYDRFLDFMLLAKKNKSQQRPFFAWLHVYPPHDPYLPPKPYLGIFGDAGMLNSEQKQLKSGLLESAYDPAIQDDIDILRKRYDEFIAYSDKQLELFMERLEESVDLSNTIVIFLSDHGESFSHGYQGHSGEHLFQQLVHVPLVIKLPEGPGFHSGDHGPDIIDTPVGLIDIAPTILEFAGLSIPGWMEGRSLKHMMEGKVFESKPVYSMQFINNRSLGVPITKGTISVWEDDYKLIHYLDDNKTLLFNLASDPHEENNLFHIESKKGDYFLQLIKNELSKANEKIIKTAEK